MVRKSSRRDRSLPEFEHVMGWDISEKGFRIVLSREVPEVVHQHSRRDVDAFLQEQGLSRSDIGSWILHTGGPRVLEATKPRRWTCLKTL